MLIDFVSSLLISLNQQLMITWDCTITVFSIEIWFYNLEK